MKIQIIKTYELAPLEQISEFAGGKQFKTEKEAAEYILYFILWDDFHFCEYVDFDTKIIK